MSDNRTLQPTLKRRQQARQEGRVAASSQIVGAVVWLVIAATLLCMGDALFDAANACFEQSWNPRWIDGEPGDLAEQLRESLLSASAFTLPILILVFAMAVVARLAQVGFLWVPGRVTRESSELNPSRRAADLFSPDKLLLMVRGGLLITCALGLTGWEMWNQRDGLLQLLAKTHFESEIVRLLANWALRLGILMAVFALLDYAYQRYRFETSLQMSSEELRAEVKAVEGNPHVTAGQKNVQQEIRLHLSTTSNSPSLQEGRTTHEISLLNRFNCDTRQASPTTE